MAKAKPRTKAKRSRTRVTRAHSARSTRTSYSARKSSNSSKLLILILALVGLVAAVILVQQTQLFGQRAADTGIPACPIAHNPSAGTYVVNFNGGLIRSDLTESAAILHSNAASPVVPKGDYKVTLVSYDKDHTATNTQVQPQESWFAQLRTGSAGSSGRVFGQTAAIADLPDKQTTLQQVTNQTLTLSEPVHGVTARHTAYKNSNANSVNPVCVVFQSVGGTTNACNYVEFTIE